ncbi:peptidoglycan binding domain-containing protein [Roseibium sp. TrichSKD4]|nr:peptidoglycan binding domain-containing protein [Roseibium sp. TrichSKD4]
MFNRAQRDFSHGCIRVAKPFDLGDVLLSPEGYSKGKLEKIRDGQKRTVIKLNKPLKVHLTYLTAWMNKDGSTHFRRDIYSRDAVLLKALREAMVKNL